MSLSRLFRETINFWCTPQYKKNFFAFREKVHKKNSFEFLFFERVGQKMINFGRLNLEIQKKYHDLQWIQEKWKEYQREISNLSTLAVENLSLAEFLVVLSFNKQRETLYFSKTPDSWCGLLLSGSLRFKNFPVSKVCFLEEQNGQENLEFLFKNISQFKYMKYLEESLLKNGYIPEALLQKCSYHKFGAVFGENFFKNSGIIRHAYNLVKEVPIYVYPKNANKKSFKGFQIPKFEKGPPPAKKFFEESLCENFPFWMQAKVVTMLNKVSFPYVALDKKRLWTHWVLALPWITPLCQIFGHIKRNKKCVIRDSRYQLTLLIQNFTSSWGVWLLWRLCRVFEKQ